jgi:hypothetical protein
MASFAIVNDPILSNKSDTELLPYNTHCWLLFLISGAWQKVKFTSVLMSSESTTTPLHAE